MNIAIDASRAAQEYKTGVEHYAQQVITHLVRYITLAQNNSLLDAAVQERAMQTHITLYCREKPNEWLLELDDHDCVTVRQLKWPVSRLWTQGRLSLEMLMRQPDVLFIPASALPLITARHTVTTIHDVGFLVHPERFDPKARSFLRWSTKRALKKSAQVLTISAFSKKEIVRAFGAQRAQAIAVVPLGVDLDRFSSITHERARKKITGAHGITRPFVLYVGRLEKKKNILGTVMAFHSFIKKYQTDHVLVLLGEPGFGWDEAQEYIERHSLADLVIQLGYVPDSDLPYWYAASDVFFFPSYYEGFGLPVLEAMASGVPVVASNAAALPEVAGDAALMAAPDDTAALAALLHMAVGDADERARLIAAGKKRASIFSWEVCAVQTFAALWRAAR